MKLNYETKDKEKSRALLTITVDKEEISSQYQELLKEAQKNAQIKGFRKGKVPVSVLESKYKKGFLADAANKIIDSAFKEVIDKVEKKPITYSMPTLENFELPELDKDYTFELSYDVFPAIEIGEYKNIEFEKDEVKISDDDVKNQLDRYLKDFSSIGPKEGAIDDDDIVTIDYQIFYDGNEFDKKENERIHVGKDFDMYKLGSDIIGLKKGDEKELEKTFDDKEIEKIAGKTFKISLKILEVKKEVKPELTDDLANEIDENCKTVDELKKKIKEDLKKFADNSIKQKAVTHAMEKVVETFKGEIPDSMIDQQQELYFREIVNRVGGNEKRALDILKMDKLDKDSYKEKMKDPAINEIKRALILQEIVIKENIEVTEDEVKDYIEPYAKQFKTEVDELLKKYQQFGNYETIKGEVESQKALDLIYDNLKIKKGKKINYIDLMEQN